MEADLNMIGSIRTRYKFIVCSVVYSIHFLMDLLFFIDRESCYLASNMHWEKKGQFSFPADINAKNEYFEFSPSIFMRLDVSYPFIFCHCPISLEWLHHFSSGHFLLMLSTVSSCLQLLLFYTCRCSVLLFSRSHPAPVFSVLPLLSLLVWQ